MDISRRHFLLGTAGAAAGLILPSYYRRALEFIDRAGRPLLEPAGRPKIELIAVPSPDWTDLAYALTVGNPYAGPPPMTLRQFSDRYEIDLYSALYGCTEKEAREDWGEVVDWDDPVDWDHDVFFDYVDRWVREADDGLVDKKTMKPRGYKPFNSDFTREMWTTYRDRADAIGRRGDG